MENWTLTWTKLTALTEGIINSIPTDKSGVYRLSYKSNDGNYYVFYVGQAEDIKKRLLEHLSVYEENECIKDHLRTKECFFRYAVITRKNVRDATERAAYREYKPSCNYQEPSGSDTIQVNLS